MMNIPIENQDLLNALVLLHDSPSRNGNIVKVAETH